MGTNDFTADEEITWKAPGSEPEPNIESPEGGNDTIEEAEVLEEVPAKVLTDEEELQRLEDEPKQEPKDDEGVDGEPKEVSPDDESQPKTEPEPQQESRAARRIRTQAERIQELDATVRQLQSQQAQQAQPPQQEQPQGLPDDYEWTNEDIARFAAGGPSPEDLINRNAQAAQQGQPQQESPQLSPEQEAQMFRTQAARDSIYDAASIAERIPNDWEAAISDAKYFPDEVVIGAAESANPVETAYNIAKDFDFQVKLAGMNPRQRYVASSTYKVNGIKATPNKVSTAPPPLKTIQGKPAKTGKSKFEMTFEELEAVENAKGYDPFD